eukprot:8631320-Pyramimonas_sp.AAC.1
MPSWFSKLLAANASNGACRSGAQVSTYGRHSTGSNPLPCSEPYVAKVWMQTTSLCWRRCTPTRRVT